MTKPKSRYAADPFLKALGAASRKRLLTRGQAAGFLGIGLIKLDEWRSRDLPPPFVDLKGMIRYKVGDLMDFVDGLPTSQLRPPSITPSGAAPLPVPTDELQRIGMYAPLMRGGRRKRQPIIASLSTWLAWGSSDSTWRFLMLDGGLQRGCPRCPVDMLAMLDVDDVPDDAPWEALTIRKYAAALALFAAAVSATNTERFLLGPGGGQELPPRDHSRSA